MMKLKSKVAIVTGGTRGLGAATAVHLMGRGARVIVADIDDLSHCDNAVLAAKPCAFRKLDVRDMAAWQQMLDSIVAEYGTVDILHLNAGIAARPCGAAMDDDPLGWFDEAVMGRILDINVRGVINGIMAALPRLRASQGSIVVTGSIAATRGWVADPLYCMSKHAVIGAVRALAPRLIQDGIAINAVCPGGMDTRMPPPGQPSDLFSSTDHVAEIVCRVIEGGETGGIWLVPADGSLRRFDVDPMAYTTDQAGPNGSSSLYEGDDRRGGCGSGLASAGMGLADKRAVNDVAQPL